MLSVKDWRKIHAQRQSEATIEKLEQRYNVPIQNVANFMRDYADSLLTKSTPIQEEEASEIRSPWDNIFVSDEPTTTFGFK